MKKRHEMHTSKYRIVRGIAYQHVIERERSASAYYPVPYATMLALLLHLVSECFSGEWFSVSIDDAVSRHLLVSGCKLSRMCTFSSVLIVFADLLQNLILVSTTASCVHVSSRFFGTYSMAETS